jgi:upstream activation factor subunit UAF30
MTTAPKNKPASPRKGEAAASKKSAEKAPSAFNKPLQPSPELAEIVGAEPLARTEVVSKVWDYIRKHKLQNPENKREILADAKLAAVFGQDKATMFEMNKFFAKHLK